MSVPFLGGEAVNPAHSHRKRIAQGENTRRVGTLRAVLEADYRRSQAISGGLLISLSLGYSLCKAGMVLPVGLCSYPRAAPPDFLLTNTR